MYNTCIICFGKLVIVRSRRFIGIGLILGILFLIIILCVSCGQLFSGILEIPDSPLTVATSTPQQIQEIKDLPTPVLQVDVPAFSEGELPVSAVVQTLVEGLVEGYSQDWSGSGTIISPEGFILTNAHLAVGDRFYRADKLTIAFTIAEDEPPVPAYLAEVVRADTAMDIAVLRIAYDLSGQRIDPSSLDLPYVQLGNSDDLRLGDPITIMGYPGIGGETITLTRGEVSGFTGEAGYGNRAFIKTSATITGGNSGGLATDENYKIIGIPTQVGAGEITGEIIDCRPLADTNQDGFINQYDTCVPTGGFINALRPINLAIPLINAAVEGTEMVTAVALPEAELPTGGIVIYEDDFSDESTGWPKNSNSDGSYFYDESRYYIQVKSANYFQPIYSGEQLSDVILRINAQVEQTSETGDFGVICRYDNNDSLYIFEITQDGYYGIFKMINGEWYPLIDYIYSDMMVNLKNASFYAACIGNTLTFAVNGKLLGEVTDESLQDGDYGFFAGTFDNGGNTVSFDNIVVTRP
jgi:S1-C subfamily serine protease